MYFKSATHKGLFEQYRQLSWAGNDREYNSLCYLLAKPLDKYFKPRNVAIRGIMAASRGWSSGEVALVKLAVNIFTDSGKVSCNEVFKRLDAENVRASLEGLTVRYGRVG